MVPVHFLPHGRVAGRRINRVALFVHIDPARQLLAVGQRFHLGVSEGRHDNRSPGLVIENRIPLRAEHETPPFHLGVSHLRIRRFSVDSDVFCRHQKAVRRNNAAVIAPLRFKGEALRVVVCFRCFLMRVFIPDGGIAFRTGSHVPVLILPGDLCHPAPLRFLFRCNLRLCPGTCCQQKQHGRCPCRHASDPVQPQSPAFFLFA